jgi:serine protease Do
VNSGNSGGPLINSRGELIGVNNSIYTGSDKDEGFIGLSFAISIPVVQRFLQANNGRAQLVNTPSPDAQRVGATPAINTNPSTPNISPAITQPQQQAPINIAFSGTLGQGDKQSGGKYYDLYRFNANAGQSLTFQMGSSTFWGRLGVMDPYGRMIDINGTGNSNPQLTITIPQTGSYFLVASSAQPGAQGDYKVIGGPAQSTQLASYKLTSFNPKDLAGNLSNYTKPLGDLYKWLLGLFKTSHK